MSSEAADRDVTEIYKFSYRQFGPSQAESYHSSLHDCSARLAELPDMGRSVRSLRKGYYRFAHVSHVVFYVKCERGVRIMRVLHASMDPERHL